VRRIAAGTALLLLAACAGGGEYSPRGTLPDVPEAFTWPGWKGAETFELIVFRRDDSELFRVEGLSAKEHPIDHDLRRRLLGARDFTWVVRGFAGGSMVGRSERIPVRLDPYAG